MTSESLCSRLRWKGRETCKTARMLVTSKTCINWVRSRFVQDDDGNPAALNEGETYLPFSLFDNPDVKFRQTYEAGLQKIKDKATRERLIYGNWDFVSSNDMAAYHSFDGEKHLVAGLKEKVYDPLKPIINSWDFNVSPFMGTLGIQIDYANKKFYILDEILGMPKEKENNTPKLARKVSKKYLNEQHMGGLLITGDPAGLARSTQTEDGVNNFTIITSNIDNKILKPQVKLLRKQPGHTTRLEFINSLYEGYDGWEILIDLRCRRFAEDMTYQTKNSDGTKCKKKVTDPLSGNKYEKYGHLSDCFDYAICYFLDDAFKKFQKATTPAATTCTVDSTVYGNFNY